MGVLKSKYKFSYLAPMSDEYKSDVFVRKAAVTMLCVSAAFWIAYFIIEYNCAWPCVESAPAFGGGMASALIGIMILVFERVFKF